MLTHLDRSERPFAGEARRPTKKGPQNQLPCQGSHRRRGTSAHQARLTLNREGRVGQKRQTELLASLSQQATVIIIIIIMEQQYEPFKQYLSYRKMARHVCISWSQQALTITDGMLQSLFRLANRVCSLLSLL